mgnify:FL=1
MSFSELQLRIALTMLPEIGPITAKNLIHHLGSVNAIFHESPEKLRRIRGIGPRLSASVASTRLLDEAGREEEFIARHHISVSYYKDPDYPRRLKECADGPILLYSRGRACLNAVQIGRAHV